MERSTLLWLAVVLTIILYLSPAHALNCTKFKGDERSLCKEINPLDISEREKRKLMKSDVYGVITIDEEPINLDLEGIEQEVLTTSEIYEENISLTFKIVLFILFNYFLFAFLTKSPKIMRWLRADS